jgi:hypothetical protein
LLIQAAALKAWTLRKNITKSMTVIRFPAASQFQHRQQLNFMLKVSRLFLHSGQVVFLPPTANPSSRATSRMGTWRLMNFMSSIALPSLQLWEPFIVCLSFGDAAVAGGRLAWWSAPAASSGAFIPG